MTRSVILYFRTIVTAGSFLALLILGWPLADEYFAHSRAGKELDLLEAEFEQLKQQQVIVEARQIASHGKLDAYVSRSITANSLISVRESIVAVVRKHGCRIRQIGIEELSERPWAGSEDDPLTDSTELTTSNSGLYNLVSSRMSLTITGGFSDIKQVCDEIAEANYLAATEYVSLQPVDPTGSLVQIELRFKFFGITEESEKPLDGFSDELDAFEVGEVAVNG